MADVLAALCVLSYQDGHRNVCSALSELRVTLGEKFRFAFLVDSLKLNNDNTNENLLLNRDAEDSMIDDLGSIGDEAAIWEYRTSVMVLINALTNSPEDLEERLALREEFTRRGLNEAMVVSFESF